VVIIASFQLIVLSSVHPVSDWHYNMYVRLIVVSHSVLYAYVLFYLYVSNDDDDDDDDDEGDEDEEQAGDDAPIWNHKILLLYDWMMLILLMMTMMMMRLEVVSMVN
jgi:hypothetical protein